jgi:hypothetical protein
MEIQGSGLSASYFTQGANGWMRVPTAGAIAGTHLNNDGGEVRVRTAGTPTIRASRTAVIIVPAVNPGFVPPDDKPPLELPPINEPPANEPPAYEPPVGGDDAGLPDDDF